MNTAPALSAELYAVASTHRLTWRLAYWISQIASPPVLGIVTIILAAARVPSDRAWLWALTYIVTAVAVPAVYIAWLVQRGTLTDFHLPVREQRIRPLLCALATAITLWGLFWMTPAPPLLRWLAGVNAVQTTLFFAITLRWKISLHTTTAANLTALAVILLGTAATPLAVLVLLIAWARVHLQRHTVAQTAGGALLGSALLIAAHLIG